MHNNNNRHDHAQRHRHAQRSASRLNNKKEDIRIGQRRRFVARRTTVHHHARIRLFKNNFARGSYLNYRIIIFCYR